MATSIIKKWLYKINESYFDYFVTGRHPVVQYVMSSSSWIIWTVIIIAFFSLLYFELYAMWLEIVAILALLEIMYIMKK